MLSRFKNTFQGRLVPLKEHAIASFFLLIALLFGIIALGTHLRAPREIGRPAVAPIKETRVFSLAEDRAFVTVPAKVRKESVVSVVALRSGIVSSILTAPGRAVAPGQALFILTDDYASGKAALEKELANEQAELTATIADRDKKISRLEEKKTKEGALDDTGEALELARIKKERKVSKSRLEQSRISLRISGANDAVFKPKVFVSGVAQNISVRRGEFVPAGTVLATVFVPGGAATLEALIDPKTARLIDMEKDSELRLSLNRENLSLRPTYFSRTEDENGLFSVLFTLSPALQEKIVDGEFVRLSLPLLPASETRALIPIDAIFQENKTAALLVERDGIAVSQPIMLGNLYGSFAEVLSGLAQNDKIILNRSVIAGDTVSVLR